MVKINWTNEAVQWLNDIYNYIHNDNPEAAKRVIEEIYNKVQILIEFPEIGYKYDKIPNYNIRILLYGHYRIAYLLKTDNNIDILGVFHGALDIEKYLI